MKRARLRRSRLRRKAKARTRITNAMLDAACRAVVFERDKYRCRKSGSTEHLQWAHVYSRRYLSVRWDPDNSMCLAAREHLWWHAQPVAAAQWWLEEVGEDFHFRLRGRLLAGQKVDRAALLDSLRKRLQRLKEGRDAA